MTQELKQDVLALAGLIAQVAETEADLGTPTEMADVALESAIKIVSALEGEDSDEVAILNEARIRIQKSLEEFVY